jgi:hypothetical protein
MLSRRLHYEVSEDGAPAASDEGAREAVDATLLRS